MEIEVVTEVVTDAAGKEGGAGGFIEFFSTPFAMGLFLSLMLLLVAILVGYVLVALHLVRKNSEKIEEDERARAKIAPLVSAQDGQNVTTLSGDYRFPTLTRIDAELGAAETELVAYDTCSLEVLCDSFRNFAAGKLGLYYDIADIRRFIAGMGISRLIILRGMSGTGKTSLAYAAGEFFGNSSTVVPIQPMWKERSDMIGYFNEFTKKFSETTMLAKLYEAGCKRDIYITVLDEVNISRIEYYFAEFLSLLELPDASRRYLDVVSDTWSTDPRRLVRGKLLLPENMWFIGTANNDDSTFAISDKVYDRAMVMNLDKKTEVFDAPYTEGMRVSQTRWKQLVSEAKEEYGLTSRSLRKIKKLDSYMIEKCNITFGNRIMKQIKEYVPVYVACGGEESAAIDEILSRKVMRKLESQNPIYVKKIAEEFCNYIDDVFGTDKMPLCKEAIRNIARNA